MTKTPKDVYVETVESVESVYDRGFFQGLHNAFDSTKPHIFIETKRVIRDGAPVNIDASGTNSFGMIVDQMIHDALERGDELAEIKLDLSDKWPDIQKAALELKTRMNRQR